MELFHYIVHAILRFACVDPELDIYVLVVSLLKLIKLANKVYLPRASLWGGGGPVSL